MRSGFLRFTFLLMVVALAVPVLQAQVATGTVTGSVTDQTEAVIPGARITLTDTATQKQHTTTSDSQGGFTFASLSEGFYSLIIEAQGFAKFSVPKLQVNVGQTSKVIAKMEIAKVGSEVVVTSEQSVVETESIELKNSVDRAQIINLPLPTRNPLDLVRTMPGIVTPTSSGIADAFVHGLRGNSVNLRQDGIDVADNTVKTSSLDRKSTRLNSSHIQKSRMPSSA